ncbi:hypothetical protein HYT84_03330 [Candidatus Micrarchaeota archaeon]|nr:hypothetical protein [Candidatus Micrarchaeota archaeon]
MRLYSIHLFLFIVFLFFGCTLSSYEKKYEVIPPTDKSIEKKEAVNQIKNHEYKPQNASSESTYQESSQKSSDNLNMQWSMGKCEDKGLIKLTASPMDIDKLGYIEPMGKLVDAHVTPSDHQYWHPKNINPDYTVDEHYAIYSPAEGHIVRIEHMTNFIGDKNYNKKVDDYRLDIEHSCQIYSYYIHIDELSDRILKESIIGDKPYVQTRIKVNSGEKLGVKNTPSFDFAVIDTATTLKGFVKPEHYEREAWKIYTVDPFDYFEEPLSSQLISKSIRSADPKGGKIAYDIDGKLVGNWFKEGTNGYAGADEQRYWSGHLSIVYDYIDPSQIRVSLGTFKDKAAQFGVKGNSPDPSSISKSSGLVKYELVSYDYYVNGKRWDRLTFANNIKSSNSESEIRGVILLQLIEDGKLKVEIFPDRSASEVSGFTGNVQIYER